VFGSGFPSPALGDAFPLDADCLLVKSCGFQHKTTDIFLTILINSYQELIRNIYRIIGHSESLLPGDGISYLLTANQGFLGNPLGSDGNLDFCWLS
jgi:hypothetical protein